jgi:hypothetical protein
LKEGKHKLILHHDPARFHTGVSSNIGWMTATMCGKNDRDGAFLPLSRPHIIDAWQAGCVAHSGVCDRHGGMRTLTLKAQVPSTVRCYLGSMIKDTTESPPYTVNVHPCPGSCWLSCRVRNRSLIRSQDVTDFDLSRRRHRSWSWAIRAVAQQQVDGAFRVALVNVLCPWRWRQDRQTIDIQLGSAIGKPLWPRAAR